MKARLIYVAATFAVAVAAVERVLGMSDGGTFG